MFMRPFQKLGFEVSTFGMGAMRLSELPDGTVDYDASTRLMREAIDRGVNYFDTAHVYHNGLSEVAVGKALQDGYREKVKIATKLATWNRDVDAAIYEQQLDLSLERLQVDCVDFYLFHSVGADSWDRCKGVVLPFLDKMVQKGKIRYPSFSFHGSPALFRQVVDAYDWQMAQVQINFLDEDVQNQASLSGVRYAGSKGIPVVVMEPLRGGALARTVPPEVQALYDAFPTRRSAAEWAFRYVYDMPEVVTILSGISLMEHLEDDLRIFADARPHCMSAEEKELIVKVRNAYNARMKTGCTGCEYCMPCPAGVSIPQILRGYDSGCLFDDLSRFQENYAALEKDGKGQDKCIECGACESKCPQKIAIIQKLKDAATAAK